ncbi:MAG: rhomboid family intramembrane serine protease [Bacteroidetes bacterium]|nr:MAG: rhomboid family intramembrane serine protease [Bacteroidota bacterium]
MIIIIIAITSLISIIAFKDRGLFHKLLFSPYIIRRNKQFYRFVTYGFLHGDYMHLFVNMFVLFSFGRAILIYFNHYLPNNNTNLLFLELYFGGLILSSVFDYFKHKDNYGYSAVGASGAVSAVLFSTIFFAPMQPVYFFGVLPIPGIIFGGLYLFYEYKMSKKNNDNIGHAAHISGAIFGLIFPLLIKTELIQVFINNF